MPIIKMNNKIIECRVGDNLRKVLLESNLSPHNQNLKWCPTNNVFFKGSILKRTKYIFDEKLNN